MSSRDVIGDPLRQDNQEINFKIARRRDVEKVTTSRVGFQLTRVSEIILRWKKMSFRDIRKRSRLGRERRARGSEFQTVGEANEKERRPFADRIIR